MRAPQRADWGWSLLERSSNCHIPNIKPLRHSIRNVLPGLKRNKTGKNSTVVQSSLFIWKYILLFIWKSRSWSLKEQWQGWICHLLMLTVVTFLFFYHIQVNTANCREIFRALHASIGWQILKRCQFPFPTGLSTWPQSQNCYHAADHVIIVCDWPAKSADLNPNENLWNIVKRKMRCTSILL